MLTPLQIEKFVEVITDLAKAVANDAAADPNESWIGETHHAQEIAREELLNLFYLET